MEKVIYRFLNTAAQICAAANDFVNAPINAFYADKRQFCGHNGIGRSAFEQLVILRSICPLVVAAICFPVISSGALHPLRFAVTAAVMWGLASAQTGLEAYLNGEAAEVFPLTTAVRARPLFGAKNVQSNPLRR